MTDFRQAAEKAMNLGKQLKAVVEVGEFLASIADAEQVKREADAAAEAAVKLLAERKAQLEETDVQLTAAEGHLSALKDEAEKVSRDAKSYAEAVQAEARKLAKDILAEAKAEIEGLQSEADKQLEATVDQQLKAEKARDAAQARLDALKAEEAGIRKRLLGE